MDSHTLFYEFKRLMKENKKQYIGITAVLFVLLMVVLMLPVLLNLFNNDNDNSGKMVQSNANPAIFEMYIEYETGNSFTNTILLEEAMKSAEFIEGAEKATGVEISDLLDNEDQTAYPKTARDRGVLGASRDESSNIWIFSSKVGTEEENLAVIDYFYERFANNEVELLQNKSRYIMSGPRVLTDEELLSPSMLVEQDTSGVFSIKNLLISLIVSLMGSVVLGFMFILFKTFFTNKIHYAFNYSWSEEDLFVLSSKADSAAFNQAIRMPVQATKLYIAQAPEQLPVSDLPVIESIVQNDLNNPVDEIVILIQPNITEKTWYNQQRELSKVYRTPLKVVQVND